MPRYEIDKKRYRIDLYFDAKPSQAVLNELKRNSWRWNPSGGCWYNKYTDDTLKLAEKFANSKPSSKPKKKDSREPKPKLNSTLELEEQIRINVINHHYSQATLAICKIQIALSMKNGEDIYTVFENNNLDFDRVEVSAFVYKEEIEYTISKSFFNGMLNMKIVDSTDDSKPATLFLETSTVDGTKEKVEYTYRLKKSERSKLTNMIWRYKWEKEHYARLEADGLKVSGASKLTLSQKIRLGRWLDEERLLHIMYVTLDEETQTLYATMYERQGVYHREVVF